MGPAVGDLFAVQGPVITEDPHVTYHSRALVGFAA